MGYRGGAIGYPRSGGTAGPPRSRSLRRYRGPRQGSRCRRHHRCRRGGATSKSVPRVDFRRVSVTGSNTSLKRPERTNGYWSVPKKDLVFPAVAAFQQGKIRIAKGIKDRDALVHELKNYSRKTNIATGNMAFEPWRESDHDDLLFAVCLALWGWQVQKRGTTRLRVVY
jgi:hypothetical protein